MSKFDRWDIELSYGIYIKRLIQTRMPRRSSDLAKERINGDVISTAIKANLQAEHGAASTKAYLRKTVSSKCINYCRDYDPETDMRILLEKFGQQRDIARRRRERCNISYPLEQYLSYSNKLLNAS